MVLYIVIHCRCDILPRWYAIILTSGVLHVHTQNLNQLGRGGLQYGYGYEIMSLLYDRGNYYCGGACGELS